MFLLLFCLWVVFNGRLTWEIAAFGVVIAGAVTWFGCKYLGYSPKAALRAVRRLPMALRYLATLVKEIVKSNLAITRIVYGRRAVRPRLVSFTTPVRSNARRALLADSITVTPGTITVHCEDGRMTVHCLDGQFSEGVEDCVFQRMLEKAEREVEAE